jgi:cell division protein FtsI (penicillin-binding protein 3)
MLDEAKANASTFGYATAGWVAAPGAGRVVSRIGPMLGLLPETANAQAIAQSLYIPLVPGRPPAAAPNPSRQGAPGVAGRPGQGTQGQGAQGQGAQGQATRPAAPPPAAAPARQAPPAPAAPAAPRDPRQEATIRQGTVVAVR